MILQKLIYLRKLLSDLLGNENNPYESSFLFSLLDSKSLYENSGNTETYRAGFALSRAKERLCLIKENSKKAFGIHELISALSLLDKNEMIDFIYLEDNQFVGTCFVFMDKILGHEFVLKKGCKTQAYDGT